MYRWFYCIFHQINAALYKRLLSKIYIKKSNGNLAEWKSFCLFLFAVHRFFHQKQEEVSLRAFGVWNVHCSVLNLCWEHFPSKHIWERTPAVSTEKKTSAGFCVYWREILSTNASWEMSVQSVAFNQITQHLSSIRFPPCCSLVWKKEI